MSHIATESKNKGIVAHLDVIVTTWVLAIGAYAHLHVFPFFMVAGGISFLYLLYYWDNHGIFSQWVRALVREIDIISFPVISKNQAFFKALINIGLLVFIYVVSDWINLIGLFYLCLALYLAFFIIYMKSL